MKFKIITLSFLSIFNLSCSKNTPTESHVEQKEISTPAKMSASNNTDHCFKLEANKSFTMSDDETEIQITTTTFNGQNAIAIIKQKNGVRTDYIYDLTGRTMLANLDYGIAALGSNPNEVLVQTTYIAPFPTHPSNMKPQQKFQMAYNAMIQSQIDDNDKSESNKTIDVEFVGFENLTLIDNNDQTLNFNNVCHFSSQVDNETLDEWYAEGYGQIKYVRKKANGEIKSSEAIGDEPVTPQ